MTSMLSRRRVVAALAGLPLLGLAPARRAEAGHKPNHNPEPEPTPTPAPDFTLSTNLGSDYPEPSNLLRGGRYDGDYGPLSRMWSYGGCFYVTTVIYVTPRNDFIGTVTLEILNLPAGVTSQTATSVTITDWRMANATLKLFAASDAALGNATVTVRATSGAIMHTLDLEFWVVDELPFCDG
ncbi:MAG: hypothetical protein ACRDJH_10730 [Thermomicrobiales bacterium]